MQTLREAQYQFGRLMREINHKILLGDSFESIFEFLFESMDTMIPYDRIGIALVEGDFLCSKWMKSRMPNDHLKIGYRSPLAGSSLQTILDTGRPRVLNDLEQYSLQKPQSESTKLALKDGIRSSLTCPVYSNNVPIGIVFFSSGKPNTYKSEHVETYLEIADELSFIIDQDRVRQDAERGRSTNQNVRMLLHDLKSPLGVIQGFLQIAQGEDWYSALDQDAKDIFATLQRNALRMQDLLNELAELNSLKFSDLQLNAYQVTLLEFIEVIGKSGREMASKKAIAFHMDTSADLPATAFFDPLKIRRAVDNILSNAVKYSARGTHIHLRVRYRDQKIYFEVQDEGLGIPASEFPKLFQEFGKTSVRPTEGESSSGIGLAIVRKITEQHRGHVFFQSEVGKGSTFGFWIPV